MRVCFYKCVILIYIYIYCWATIGNCNLRGPEVSLESGEETGGNQQETYEKNFLAERMEHLLSFFFLLHFYHEEVPSGIFFERKQDRFVRNQISLKGQVHGSAHAHFSKCCMLYASNMIISS